MHPDWTLSLFHDCNHGAAVGRVLGGMQVPERQQGDFESFLKELAYPYTEETDNPAYRLFSSQSGQRSIRSGMQTTGNDHLRLLARRGQRSLFFRSTIKGVATTRRWSSMRVTTGGRL